MQLGMVGLGRMGANLVRRLMHDGHKCVVYDVNKDAIDELEGEGATGGDTLDEFLGKLSKPRAVWVMVPAAFTGDTVMEIAKKMDPGDIIIDGGNSYYRDDIDHAKALAEMNVHYVDCGTSGGVFGLDRGFCLMIGGENDIVEHLDPIFKTIAPGVDTAPRTPGLTGEPSTAENGYLHCGPNGAGHFVKMVHNGIEYGMMAAYAEGLNVFKHANVGKQKVDERRGDHPAPRPAVLPVRHRPSAGGRGVAARQRRRVLVVVPKIESVPSWLSKTCSRRLCCGQSASAATRMLQKPPGPLGLGKGSTVLTCE